MASGSRPGGLTALAVLNFIFAGWATIGVMGIMVLVGVKSLAPDALERELAKDPEARKAFEQLPDVNILLIIVGLLVIQAIVLITAGVGYLKQKRFLGRMMGNLYAVFALTGFGLTLALMPGQFGLLSLIDLIYPVLTLILINATFKDDFINP